MNRHWELALVRTATALLIVALVTLIVSALFLQPRTTEQADDALASADPNAAVLLAFEKDARPLLTVDIGTLYAGREELIDPREALPTWHRHARAEAAMVFAATQSCPPRALTFPLSDVALVKAYSWFERTCKGGLPPEDLLASPPFMHPSGKSYAALAMARVVDAKTFARREWKKLHVLELAQIGGADADVDVEVDVDVDAEALAELGSREWLGLWRGDRVVQTIPREDREDRREARLVIAERGPLGLARLRFHDRSALRDVVLVPRSSSSVPCARPASSLLCWEATAPRRNAARQRFITGVAAAMASVCLLVLGSVFVRERRRAALDRSHLLRTLTHELRTPAMALGLDIEPLRRSYDDLPTHLQEPLLRISAGIARLHRVLHHSARTLELFEGRGTLATPIAIESAHEMLKDFAAEWPKQDQDEAVTLLCEGDDGAIVTDPEWLSVAVRNLVENACKHGKSPVVVRVRLSASAKRDLLIRVEDAGSTPEISLRHTAAWTRKKETSGLGLGLSLVARIANNLGGTLTHEPRPTAFVLRIPSRKEGVQ